MRFVRAIAGMLLLIIGLPALIVGGALGVVTRHADPSGAFTARFETVHTAGHAVVVTDLGELLRREAPFARFGQQRIRLEARTPDGPAFVGLAPTDEVRRWLEHVPHDAVRRVALARGPLPIRLDGGGTALPAGTPAAEAAPIGRPFWVREGIGALEWTPDDLAGRSLSLVVTRPDGRPDFDLEMRAELRAGWTAPATWGLLAGGVLLVALAVLFLLRPPRPREVVFVVEPDQVPVLAGRLGVSSLSGLGAQPTGSDGRVVLAQRQLAAVGSGPTERSRAALGASPDRRPASLADLVAAEPTAKDGATLPAPPPELSLTLAWPPVAAEGTPQPVPAGRLRPATPAVDADAAAAGPAGDDARSAERRPVDGGQPG
ncbi:hypothetical protein [Micromonospora sp. NPDC093243]|uniref:hypothetical protein n=1 Tax=Micromonospora sp. NPDC093243 TaxID=3364290 RepID=UPI0038263434